ncbi:MAG TPA: hypothetical protein VFA85_09630 [Terriglobales bacterium]|nr:hypothetical protein [Terriglobales bacterium]
MPTIHFVSIFAVSTSGNLVVAAAFGVGAGVYFFYRGFRLLQRRRLILNTPSSKIRSASMGLVEISGLATGPHVIPSPLKQLDCFYYRSIAWEWRREGKNSRWVKIGEEKFHLPFYIDDGTGTVLIGPTGAEMDLQCDFREEYGSLFGQSEMPDGVTQFLSRVGADFGRRLKVEEYSIQPKHFLFVLGTLAQNPQQHVKDPVPATNPAAPQSASVVAASAVGHSRPLVDANGMPLVGANYRQIIHLGSDNASQPATEMTQQQRVAAALTKAGITNPAAWAVAGVKPENAVRPYAGGLSRPEGSPTDQAIDGSNFDPHPPVALMQGTHDPTFFISWRSQKDVLSSLGWKSALMIWGGPALTLACVYFLLANFGLL